MIYRNPFHLLNLSPDDIGQYPMGWLKMKQKELLAEFELHEGNSILLEGVEMDKHSVLQLLEELKIESHFNYHLFIYQNKPLYHFLHAGSLDLFEYRLWTSAFDDSGFTAFVSPYFAAQYNQVFLQMIEDKNILALQNLTRLELPLSLYWQAQAYRSAYQYWSQQLTKRKSELASYSHKTVSLRKAKKLGRTEELELLSTMPAYFQPIVHRYADFLQKIIIEIYQAFPQHYNPEKDLNALLRLKLANGMRTELESFISEHKVLWVNRSEVRAGNIISYLLMAIFFFLTINYIRDCSQPWQDKRDFNMENMEMNTDSMLQRYQDKMIFNKPEE